MEGEIVVTISLSNEANPTKLAHSKGKRVSNASQLPTLPLYLAFFCFFKYVSLCKIWLLESLVEYSLISFALYTDDSPHTITDSLFFHILIIIILSILFKFCFCNLHA